MSAEGNSGQPSFLSGGRAVMPISAANRGVLGLSDLGFFLHDYVRQAPRPE
jgi:hypothetical protein